MIVSNLDFQRHKVCHEDSGYTHVTAWLMKTSSFFVSPATSVSPSTKIVMGAFSFKVMRE